jgi:hypothetical protein
MGLSQSEYSALRQTIATRGTVRMVLLPASLLGWALATSLDSFAQTAGLGAIVALAVLVGGFEAVHALHVGVERIGRYLQVFYEGEPGAPRWETTAMAVGPALPGGGVDPLFTVVFGLASVTNLAGALLAATPDRVWLGILVLAHAAFLVRLVRARVAAARQRAVELESYRVIKARQPAGTD